MADDIATLGLRVDSSSVKSAERDLANFTDTSKRAAAGNERFSQTVDAMKRQVESVVSPLRNLQTLLIGYGVERAVQSMVALADSYTLIAARIGLVTSSTAEAQAVQQRLFDIAQSTGQSFEAVAQTYTRVARNASQLGASQEQLIRFTKTLSEAMIVSGATSQEAANGMIQLSQGIAAGRLQGQDLRAVLEDIPYVGQLIAKSMGLTIGQLRQLAQEGVITSQEVVNALLKASAQVDADTAKMPLTVGRAITELENQWGRYIDQVNTASGATRGIAGAVQDLTDRLSDPALVEKGVHAIELLASGIEKFADDLPFIETLAGDVGSLISVIVDGWAQLPEAVQELGIVGALVLGTKGRLALASIGLAVELMKQSKPAAGNLMGADESFGAQFAANAAGIAQPNNAPDPTIEAKKNLDDYAASLKRTIAATGGARAAAADLLAFMKSLGVQIGDDTGLLKANVEWSEKDAEKFKQLVQTVDPAADAMADLTDQTALLHKAQAAHIISAQQETALETKAIEVANKRLDKTAGLTDEIKKQIKAEQDHLGVLKLQAAGQDFLAQRLQLENEWRERLKDQWDTYKDQVEQIIDAQMRLGIVMSDDQAVEQRSQEQAQAWVEIWKNAAGQIQQAFANVFLSMFDGGENLAKSLANVFKQLFAQIATQMVFGNLLAGMAGAPGSGGGGSSASMFSGAAGGAAAGILPNLSALPVWGQAGLGAGIGALAGGGIGGAIGLNKTGSSIGGGLGGFGALPFVLAGGNPLIALGFMALTTVLGGLFGNLIAGKPSDKTAGYTLNLQNGFMRNIGNLPGSDKFSAQNDQAAQGVMENIKTLTQQLLSITGGKLGGANFIDLLTGDRDGTRLRIDGGAWQQANSPQEAAAIIVNAIVSNIEDVGPVVKKALGVLDFVNNAQDSATLLQFAVDLQKLLDGAKAKPISDVQQAFNSLDAQLEDFRAKVVLIGQDASVADDAFAKLHQQIIDAFVKDLNTRFNAVSGHGFLNDIQDVIDQHGKDTASATDAGAGMEKANAIFTQSIKNIVHSIVTGASSADDARASLDLIKATFAEMPDIIAIVEDALGGLTASSDATAAAATAAADAQAKAASAAQASTMVMQALQDRLNSLGQEAQDLNARINQLTSISSSTDDAILQLLTGQDFGVTPTDALAKVRDVWSTTQAAAAGGDLGAQAQLPQLGLELVKLSRQVNASGSEFFADRDAVLGALTNQKSVAVQQLEVAKAQLSANQAAVQLLQIQVSNLQKTGNITGQQTFTPGDLDALTASYTAQYNNVTRSGGDISAFVGGDYTKGVQSSLLHMIGGVSDVGRLLNDYNGALGQESDSLFGGLATERAGAIANRLTQLGVQIPGRAIGGRGGMAFRAHPGEVLFLGQDAQVLSPKQAQDSLARGAGSQERMEQAYRVGTQATLAAMAEMTEEIRSLKTEVKRNRDELRRIKEKVG